MGKDSKIKTSESMIFLIIDGLIKRISITIEKPSKSDKKETKLIGLITGELYMVFIFILFQRSASCV